MFYAATLGWIPKKCIGKIFIAEIAPLTNKLKGKRVFKKAFCLPSVGGMRLLTSGTLLPFTKTPLKLN